MDKETLSNYGWIVICVLVFAVMIALASPFGSYVASAVKNTTQGLFDVEQGALSAAGIDIADQSFDDASGGNDGSENITYTVPEGGTYTSADGTVYNAGDTMPAVTDGDSFKYDGYEYRYNYKATTSSWESNPSQNGWGVRLKTNKTECGAFLESINGQPITNMDYTFWGCSNLTIAPVIPNSVKYMDQTFYRCISLKTYVGSTDADGDFSNYVIPNGITSLWATFGACESLITAPAIPNSVTMMQGIFQECTNLTGNIEINATPESYGSCLSGTQITSISGSCSKTTKEAIIIVSGLAGVTIID